MWMPSPIITASPGRKVLSSKIETTAAGATLGMTASFAGFAAVLRRGVVTASRRRRSARPTTILRGRVSEAAQRWRAWKWRGGAAAAGGGSRRGSSSNRRPRRVKPSPDAAPAAWTRPRTAAAARMTAAHRAGTERWKRARIRHPAVGMGEDSPPSPARYPGGAHQGRPPVHGSTGCLARGGRTGRSPSITIAPRPVRPRD